MKERELKTILKGFRITKEEDAFIKEECEKYGMSESEYFRTLLRNKRADSKQFSKTKQEYLDIRELTREINYIGNNINQIVKNTHMNLYSEHEKKKLFALMELIKNKVMSL